MNIPRSQFRLHNSKFTIIDNFLSMWLLQEIYQADVARGLNDATIDYNLGAIPKSLTAKQVIERIELKVQSWQ